MVLGTVCARVSVKVNQARLLRAPQGPDQVQDCLWHGHDHSNEHRHEASLESDSKRSQE